MVGPNVRSVLKTKAEVDTGHVVHMNEDQRKVAVMALRDFERDIAGPGNERYYWNAVLLRELLEKSACD